MRCGADDRQALEQLCRYITRPALASERVLDGVNQFVRSGDIHLGRLDGDECRWLAGQG